MTTPLHPTSKIVVVLGMHRSGTSAITRGLQTMGINLGDRLEPAAENINEKGYWEDVDLVLFNEEMLDTLKRRWDSLEPISPIEATLLFDKGFLSRAIELLRRKVHGHSFFGFKDPRTSKLLPFWQQVFEAGGFEVFYILAVRNPLSIVKSLARRDQFDPIKSYLLWIDHVTTSLRVAIEHPLIAVDYDLLMQQPEHELSRVANWLGCQLIQEQVANYCSVFLETGLRHSVFSSDELVLDSDVPTVVPKIHQFLIQVSTDVTSLEGTNFLSSLNAWLQVIDDLRPILRLVDSMAKQISDEQTCNSLLCESLEAKQQLISELHHTLADRERQILSLDQAVIERDYSIIEIRNSTSWRITTPFRRLSSTLHDTQQTFRMLPSICNYGGGVAATIQKALRIFYREGIPGVAARLRFLAKSKETTESQNLNNKPSIEALLNILPYYVDPKVDDSTPSNMPNFKVAVHVFVKNETSSLSIATRLSTIPFPFDLYISSPAELEEVPLFGRIRSVVQFANKLFFKQVARDEGGAIAFLAHFKDALSDYDIVGHFSFNVESDLTYDEHALDLLLGSSGRIEHFSRALMSASKFIFPEPSLKIGRSCYDNKGLHSITYTLLAPFKTLQTVFSEIAIPMPSMFWAKRDALREFCELAIPAAQTTTVEMEFALRRSLMLLGTLHSGNCLRIHKGDSIADFRCYEAAVDFSGSIRHNDIKILSYYLPQFHPIPENDEWHGKGFTEWTKVRAANPLFEGHFQQHIPHADIGYYLLDSPDTLRKQAHLMHQSGVSGQVFYHYWFGGKLILEEPAQMLLANPDIAMPFCFCWANENWTRRWDGDEQDILLAQNYSTEDARAFIRYLIPFFRDPRHLCIEGRPVLFVYRPSSIPNIELYIDAWRDECIAAGLLAPYTVAVLTRGATNPHDFGMNAATERVLHDWTDGGAPEIKASLRPYRPINGRVLSYNDVADFYCGKDGKKPFTYFRSLVPTWDNTARYGSDAYVVHDSTPERFQEWLEALIQDAKQNLPEDRRFILVNAWNEWAEGAHLEPDSRFGYSYLNSVGRALSGISYGSLLYAQGPLPNALNVHLNFTDDFKRSIKLDTKLADRFFSQLSRSTIFKTCRVTIVEGAFFRKIPQAAISPPNPNDLFFSFNETSLFGPNVLERMAIAATNHPDSVVIPNAYGISMACIPTTNSGAVSIDDAMHAPITVCYARNVHQNVKSFHMRTDAHCFVTQPNSISGAPLPSVTTIIRFHKSGDFDLLRNALGCLSAMQNCQCIPLITAQDLSQEQKTALLEIVDEFDWHDEHKPRIIHYQSATGHGDLRAKMLNEAIRKVETRYAAFLDYDDLIMPDAYSWLIGRLTLTQKAIAFGRVYSTTYESCSHRWLDRAKSFEYGSSYSDFVDHNTAPIHSFLMDLSRLDLSQVTFHDDQTYMEDYFLTLQLFDQENADWDGMALNHYIGDYLHSVDREHTLALVCDATRERLLYDPSYRLCESRIINLRNKIKSSLSAKSA